MKSFLHIIALRSAVGAKNSSIQSTADPFIQVLRPKVVQSHLRVTLCPTHPPPHLNTPCSKSFHRKTPAVQSLSLNFPLPLVAVRWGINWRFPIAASRAIALPF